LQNLLQQGIVSSTIRNDVTYYTAISPEILQKNIEEKSQRFLETLPEFMAL
jgi:sugar-specific transcriptional regulator TrmB